MVQNNQKQLFYADFCRLGAIWAPQNGPKKVDKGLHVGGMCGPLYKVKNKPLNKSLGLFLEEKWSKATIKKIFYAVFGHFGPIKVDKGPQVGGMYGPHF
jgi:hypothetical protein